MKLVRVLVTYSAVIAASAGRVDAQADPAARYAEFVAASDAEAYLRTLHVALPLPSQQWSIRRMGPREVRRLLSAADSAHPWSARPEFSAKGTSRWNLVAPQLNFRYNTAMPYGVLDGAVWAGKGLTASLAVGGTVRYGPLSATLQPVAFYSENRAFPLMRRRSLDTTESIFADGQYGHNIDKPQRFGDKSFTTLDPGQSEVRLDLPGFALGASTANQQWGPAFRFPYILGANGGGFRHVFAGTSEGVSVGIGRVSARALWGRLDQSDYSAAPAVNAKRFAAALTAVFQPRGLEGLELGGARFFHIRYPPNGITRREVLKPFEGLLKVNLPGVEGDDPGSADSTNQLASLFARLRLPRANFEIYGEFGREDHEWDLRGVFLAPERLASRMLGVQRVWKRTPEIWWVGRAERMSHRASNITRRQGATYIHGRLQQGHTHNGQLLGADAGIETGAGVVVALDRYDPFGRWGGEYTRITRYEAGDWWDSGVVREGEIIVQHTLGLERLVYAASWDVAVGGTAGFELNHNFERDLFNLNARVSIRPSSRRR